MVEARDPAASPATNLRRRGFALGQLALGLAVLYWLIASGRFDVAVYRRLFSSEHALLVGLIVLLQFGSFTVFVYRWAALARIAGLEVPARDALRTGFQGLFLGLIMPGSTGVDGLRLVYVQQNHPDKRAAGMASILMDRLTGYLGLLLLGSAGSLLFRAQGPSVAADAMVLLNATLLLAIGLLAAFSVRGTEFPGRAWLRRFGPIARVMDALASYGPRRRELFVSLALAILTHLLLCAAWCVGVYALGESVPVSAVVAITSVLTIVRTVPITPMGLGVTDGVAEELYRIVGIETGSEVQMLIRVTAVLVFVTAGAVSLRLKARR